MQTICLALLRERRRVSRSPTPRLIYRGTDTHKTGAFRGAGTSGRHWRFCTARTLFATLALLHSVNAFARRWRFCTAQMFSRTRYLATLVPSVPPRGLQHLVEPVRVCAWLFGWFTAKTQYSGPTVSVSHHVSVGLCARGQPSVSRHVCHPVHETIVQTVAHLHFDHEYPVPVCCLEHAATNPKRVP